MPEPFSIKKAIDLSPVALGKSFSIGAKFLLILGALFCAGFTIWTLFFPKPTQNQNIIARRGSTVTVQQIQTAKKRLIIFIEPYIDQSSNRKLGTGIRVGVRWEF